MKVLLSGSLFLPSAAVSGQCLVQLHGIELQEFASICLYNVIKGFLGPVASEWQTPLAWRAKCLIGNLLANRKLIHLVATLQVVAFEITLIHSLFFSVFFVWGTLVLPSSCVLLIHLTVTLVSDFTLHSVGHTNSSQSINQSSNVTSERVDCHRKPVHPPGNYQT